MVTTSDLLKVYEPYNREVQKSAAEWSRTVGDWELFAKDPENVAHDTSQNIKLFIEFRGPKTSGGGGSSEVLSFPATLEEFSDEHKPQIEYKSGYGTGIAATSTGVKRNISMKFKLAGYSSEECVSNLYHVDRMIQWLYPRDYSSSDSVETMNSYLNSHAYNPEAPVVGLRLRNLISVHHSNVSLSTKNKTRSRKVNGEERSVTMNQSIGIGDFVTVVLDEFRANPILDAGFVVYESAMIPKIFDVTVACTVLFERQYAFNPKQSLFSGGLRFPYGANKESTIRGQFVEEQIKAEKVRDSAIDKTTDAARKAMTKAFGS